MYIFELLEVTSLVYDANRVLKLRNWSEIVTAEKDRAFEILTSFDM